MITLTDLLAQEEVRKSCLYRLYTQLCGHHEPHQGTRCLYFRRFTEPSCLSPVARALNLTLSLDITRNNGGVPILISPQSY